MSRRSGTIKRRAFLVESQHEERLVLAWDAKEALEIFADWWDSPQESDDEPFPFTHIEGLREIGTEAEVIVPYGLGWKFASGDPAQPISSREVDTVVAKASEAMSLEAGEPLVNVSDEDPVLSALASLQLRIKVAVLALIDGKAGTQLEVSCPDFRVRVRVGPGVSSGPEEEAKGTFRVDDVPEESERPSLATKPERVELGGTEAQKAVADDLQPLVASGFWRRRGKTAWHRVMASIIGFPLCRHADDLDQDALRFAAIVALSKQLDEDSELAPHYLLVTIGRPYCPPTWMPDFGLGGEQP